MTPGIGRVAILVSIVGTLAFGESLPGVASSVSQGDTAYRKADFERAAAYYRQALALDPRCPRALLGLSRVEELQFERGAARDHAEVAYRMNSRDPEIIRSYAGFVNSRDAEANLLMKYVASGGEDQTNLETARGRLEIARNLGDREIGILESPYQRYSLPMTAHYTGPRATAMLLMVRINDGKPLRLILDTGADGVLISRKAAKKLGLEYIGQKQFGGLGSGEPSEGMIGLARSLSIGELRMKNCLVDVIESVPGGEADGIIGPSLLQRFVIRLHAGRKRLELEPFPEEGGFSQERPWWGVNRRIPAGMERFTKVLQLGHFLLAPARRDGRFGYYMIDTGAAFSVVPHGRRESTVAAEVFGADGRLAGATQAEPVQFQIAGKSVTDSDVIASDLDKISAWAGVEISGVIGFPALSQNALTINYQDGLIDVGR